MENGGRKRLVLLGPPRVVWPEPLASLLAKGQIEVEVVGSVYDVAARIIDENGRTGEAAVRAVLIDPMALTKRNVAALGLLSRRVPVALMLLPLTEGANPRALEAVAHGVVMWEDALTALIALGAESSPQAGPIMPNQEATAGDQARNIVSGGDTGNSVGLEIAARYDEMGAQPLVSEAEMQALLGT